MSSFASKSTPNPLPSTESSTTAITNSTPETKLPLDSTLNQAAKLSIIEDKPIMLDYWMGSLEQSVRIGIRENGEKLLVRSDEEYTSPISKIYSSSSKTEYLIVTENSIYIVDAKIKAIRIVQPVAKK